jgi:hypothetical protein
MKISNLFISRKIADEHLLSPVGEAAMTVKGLIALSESGAMLYEKLKTGCSREDLIAALTEEYDVTESVAAQDTDAFLNQMRQLNILIEDAQTSANER